MSKHFLEYLSSSNPEMLEKLNAGFQENKLAQEEHNTLNKLAERSDAFNSFIKEAANKLNDREVVEVNYNMLQSDRFIRDEMFKMAGFDVNDTTPEGIESFLKEYFYNELSFFPDKLHITVTITPLDAAPKDPRQIDLHLVNATGTVDISYKNALIQIPFILRDKEILPFDTIQMGSETAIYTRDNMSNILRNIKQLNEKSNDSSLLVNETRNLSGYVGVDKHTNITTDSGFMGDMLQIQHMLGQNSSPNYVHASLVNELLEKTAGIKKVDIEYDSLEQEFKNKILPKMTKIANTEHIEDTDKFLVKEAFFNELDEEVDADIQILNNGDYFSFVEKEDELITDTVGIVFKDLLDIRKNGVSKTMVVTADGRYKLLPQGEGFLFNLTKTNSLPPLDIKKATINNLNSGVVYSATLGNAQLLPFTITKVNEGAAKGISIPVIYDCVDITGYEFTMIAAAGVNDGQILTKSKSDIIGLAVQREPADKLHVYNLLFSSKKPVKCLADTTKFIKLRKGVINNITSKKDKMFLFDGQMKLAAFGDKLVMVLRDNSSKMMPTYDIIATWVDKRSGRERRVEINNVDKSKATNALKTMGYDFDEISELIYQTTKEGYAEKNLGINIFPWKLEPEVGAGMAAAHTVKNLKESLFSKDNFKDAFKSLSSSILGSILSGKTAGDEVREFAVFASESEALAGKLEKIAMAKENGTFTKLAALMVIKNRVDNMVVGALEGGEYIGTEVLSELVELEPYMSKLAHDLVELKLAQAYHKDEIISPNVINSTLRHMDQLHKYAKVFA